MDTGGMNEQEMEILKLVGKIEEACRVLRHRIKPTEESIIREYWPTK